MVVERTRGTFLRLRLAPISKLQILAGKGLACFMACVSVMTVLLTLGITIFDVRIGNPLILIAAVLASAICFVGIMMAASVLGKTEQAVGGSSMAILLIFSMTGGGMIPLLFMPSWMQKVSNLSPAKWSILASEGAIWRGFSYSEMLLPLGVLISIGIVGFAIGVTILFKSYD
jgi:ABC-2 type transport system permease protein